MFESPAAALALLLGLIAIGLNLAVGLNLVRFLSTVAIVVFSTIKMLLKECLHALEKWWKELSLFEQEEILYPQWQG